MILRQLLDDAPAVRKIAVLRALQLGDLLCAVPALRALRRAYRSAEIALIGLPWAAGWSQRLPHVDRWFEFPGYPGLPERTPDLRALPGFIALMQECRFDLVVQMHGSGGIVNPLCVALNPKTLTGYHAPGAWCPDPASFIPWPEQGHEIERCLALTDALGAPRVGLHLEFPVLPCDRATVAQRWPELALRPYVCIHPGAQLASRRWPVERFAQVARAVDAAGYTVVVTGTEAEHALADAISSALPAAQLVVNLVGRTSLWQLGAVLEGARLLVCNDTGASHVAAALRTPSVVVSCGSDPARWAPLDAELHRVVSHMPACRPCGHRICPTAHECATAISADEVIDIVFEQLARHAGAPTRLTGLRVEHATAA
jgi:ADP-heptose:LPS heptosyltransferase